LPDHLHLLLDWPVFDQADSRLHRCLAPTEAFAIRLKHCFVACLHTILGPIDRESEKRRKLYRAFFLPAFVELFELILPPIGAIYGCRA